MANEIQITTRLKLSKGGATLDRNGGTVNATMAGDAYTCGVQQIGTGAHEALSLSADIGTAGWAYFKNLDATNYVEIGIDSTGTFVPFARLKAGEACVLRLATNAPYAKANTGAVNLEYAVIEE